MIKMRAIPESRLWHRCRHPDVDRQENPQYWSAWAGATLEMSATQGRCQRGSPTLLGCCLILHNISSVSLLVSILEHGHMLHVMYVRYWGRDQQQGLWMLKTYNYMHL